MTVEVRRSRLRFHLSTLLLLCILCGAAMGLYFDRDVWQLKASRRIYIFDPEWERVVAPLAPWNPYTNPSTVDKNSNKPEVRPTALEFDAKLRCMRISSVEVTAIPLTLRQVIPVPETSSVFSLSPNENELIIVGNWNVIVYRRTRAYGWIGYLQRPVFWLALAASLGLGAAFVRWVLNWRRTLVKMPRSKTPAKDCYGS